MHLPIEARNIIFSNFQPEQVVGVSVDPRIREQEFGNLQGKSYPSRIDEKNLERRCLNLFECVFGGFCCAAREVTISLACGKKALRFEDFGLLASQRVSREAQQDIDSLQSRFWHHQECERKPFL